MNNIKISGIVSFQAKSAEELEVEINKWIKNETDEDSSYRVIKIDFLPLTINEGFCSDFFAFITYGYEL